MSAKFNMEAYVAAMERRLGGQDGPARTFWKALSFAVEAHKDQRRKSGEPYISHPCEVARILVEELGVDEPETLAAAILHDTVEDVPEVTNEVIGEHFGRNVEAIVEGCTKVADFTGPRQNFYKLVHRKLFTGAASRMEVMLIKLADRLHNLRTMDSMPKHKRQKIADETLSVYAPMAKIMGLFELKREIYNLALIYKFPRQSHKIKARIKKIANSPETREIRERLERVLKESWISASIYMNPKGLSSYFDQSAKVLRKEIEIPMEIIISVPDVQTCYLTLGVVNQLFPPIPRTIRDFIANAKPTGYQSLHAKANIKGTTYLFKFRTEKMYQVGRTGIIPLWLDKRKTPGAFEKEIQEMFDILGDAGISYTDAIAASGKKEIYTFTPKGDRVCLPKDSTVLDFAFKVHTEIGARCVGAMVGGRRVGPEHVLTDGDQVKVVTRDDPVVFEPEMQKICKSPKARSVLAKAFKRRRQRLAEEIGRSIVRQEMKHYGLPREILDARGMDDVVASYDLEDRAEFFQLVGMGELLLKDAVCRIKEIAAPDYATLQPPAGALNRIVLDTLDPACIKLSRCCSPVPTEKGLFGLLSERGLSVHRKECATFKSLTLQREDVVELRWNMKKTKVVKPQTLIILRAQTRNRVMMMLGVAPDEMRIQEVIALSSLPDGSSAWEITFRVDTLQHLKNILGHFVKTGLEHEIVIEQ